MHIHILGICGTFMGGIARLAVEKGFKVTGSDKNCYPQMSDQLEDLGIMLHEGFDAEQLRSEPDCVVVGNAMSRGMEVIETLLDSNQCFNSGPQWLKENILHDKWVIAVAGTHGKTSTASMVTWILEACGFNPSFLIGGVLENFGVSARLTDSPFFVVEADEYDTAFFDKRSKFVHYRPRTCILNNLEFDHADIFESLKDIEKQFHHLIRIIPGNGRAIYPKNDEALERVLEKGCWTTQQQFSLATTQQEALSENGWSALKLSDDGSLAQIYFDGKLKGELKWNLIGDHNVKNALAAIAAAHHVGVTVEDAILSLSSFKNVKRRMELKGEIGGVQVYDDFAHHPTAIQTTLSGLRNQVGDKRIIAVVDLRSNTMKQGIHKDRLAEACKLANFTIFHKPESFDWQLSGTNTQIKEISTPEAILNCLDEKIKAGDKVLIMSNGGFSGLHDKLIERLKNRFKE